MKMFIANCTNQAQDFIYRLPEVPAPRTQRIEIGRQIQISGDLSEKDREAVVSQHSKYGLVRVSEIDRTRPFAGLCWDEKPIRVEKVRNLWRHNQSVLTARGQEQRTAAAVATNNSIEEQTPGGLKSLEMSVEELKTDKNPDPQFAEGVRVTPDASETDGKGVAKGRRASTRNRDE